MYNAIAVEDFGVPAVVLVNEGFANDARAAASGKGIPGLRIIPEPIPCESTVNAEIARGINTITPQLLAALTEPLTPAEKSTVPKETARLERIVFKGNLQEFNQFFYKRGWGDGLPLIPPTEEAVAEMLAGTDLPPNHVLAELVPRMGKATVEKVAVNAVMAGALPTHLPVLIAGVETLIDRRSRFDIYQVSTGSWAPFWIVNGPIRHDININCGSGALSPGDIANAAIGRAMGLIIKNIGGVRKGIEDMGTLGNSGKYSMVIGENEESSPWEPLHVEHGFNKSDSTISMFYPNCALQVFDYGTDIAGVLSTLAYNVHSAHSGGLACFMIVPHHAQLLANNGWSKKTVKEFLSENVTSPFYRNARYWPVSGTRKPITAPLNPQDPFRQLPDPGVIMIVVAGGSGAWNGIFTGARNPHQHFVTKKINLPSAWDKLVVKYRNMVPVYMRY